jgi:(2Fe-2S) ferredoxin
MDKPQPKFKKLSHHIFVCTNERAPDHPRGCCKAKGAEDLVAAFKAELSSQGLAGAVRAQKAGCLDVCEAGAAVVIYPEGVWYGRVTSADVSEIVRSHLVEGKPVERLRIAGK